MQGIYDKSLEFFFKSLGIKERLGNQSGIAQSLSAIGSVYYYQEKALNRVFLHFKR